VTVAAMCRYEGYDPKSEAELKAKIASVLYKDMIKADEGMQPRALEPCLQRGARCLACARVFKMQSRCSGERPRMHSAGPL
jgi:hypothetical protein